MEQQIDTYGSKKYYDDLIKILLAQSKYITPVAKAVRILLFNFSASTQASSLNNLTVSFEVTRVKVSIVAMVAATSGGIDMHIFQSSLNNGYEICSAAHGPNALSSIGQPLEFIYQQPRVFQNETITLQSMGLSGVIYAPTPLTMLVSLQLELSSM